MVTGTQGHYLSCAQVAQQKVGGQRLAAQTLWGWPKMSICAQACPESSPKKIKIKIKADLIVFSVPEKTDFLIFSFTMLLSIRPSVTVLTIILLIYL